MNVCKPLLNLVVLGLAVTASAALQGRVVRGDRTPFAGVNLVLQSSGESAITDAQGAFTFGASTAVTTLHAAQPLVQLEKDLVVIHLNQRALVSVQVFDVTGHPLSKTGGHWMDAGEFQANPYQGLRSPGMYVVRISAGSQSQSLLVKWAGNSAGSSVQKAASSTALRKAAGSRDAITVYMAGDSIGASQVLISTGTVPDVVLVQRTLQGSVLLNGNTLTSLMIDLTGTGGVLVNLDPDWDATAMTYSVVAPWRVADATVQWTASVKIGVAAGTALQTSSFPFADSASFVTIPPITLSTGGSSSSVKASSSSVAASSSSVKASSSSVAASSSSVKASSSSVAASSSSVVASSASMLSITQVDSMGAYAIDWVWVNRIKDPTEVNALGAYNFLEDKIMGEKGTLNVCVRWESTTKITQAQREKFEPMLNRSVNNWTKWLKGYDGFPYDTIKVKIVGWAVINKSYLDQTGITVPVYENGALTLVNNAWVPNTTAPYCPVDCARETLYNGTKVTTTYPNCKTPDQHFVTVLWGTDGFVGGAGTEGGARVGSDYILQNLDSQEPHIIEHEVGHGFGFPDYYTDATDCPAGNCANLPVTIMNAGASMVITDWDKWSLRRTWTEMNKQVPTRW